MGQYVRAFFSSPLLPALVLSRRETENIAVEMLKSLGLEHYGLNIIFNSDSAMDNLNRRFLSCTGPANVLAFPDSFRKETGLLGEIFINVQALSREAVLYGQQPFDHFILLLGHGILHLTGTDHGPEMEALGDKLQQSVSPETYTIKT